jgi:hypothetical protein
MMPIELKLGRVIRMNAQIFCLTTWTVLATSAMAESLYRSDVTFVSDADRQAEVEKLTAIETPSEHQYLTQIALEKPDVFARQLRRAREILRIGGEPSQISSKLMAEGFYSPDTQSILEAFFLSLHPDDMINISHAMNFVIRVNNPTDVWTHLLDATGKLDDYAALECAPNQAPTKFLGPPEHQYVIQVAHPNMELSLWRFDAREAITYPIAVATETTVETYRFIDRFGAELGILNRENLSMQLPTGDVLQCQKVGASIMRAYQDHRRELILAEKQL